MESHVEESPMISSIIPRRSSPSQYLGRSSCDHRPPGERADSTPRSSKRIQHSDVGRLTTGPGYVIVTNQAGTSLLIGIRGTAAKSGGAFSGGAESDLMIR